MAAGVEESLSVRVPGVTMRTTSRRTTDLGRASGLGRILDLLADGDLEALGISLAR
jgi:hypothetical protein